jgi:hypothetical protein
MQVGASFVSWTLHRPVNENLREEIAKRNRVVGAGR